MKHIWKKTAAAVLGLTLAAAGAVPAMADWGRMGENGMMQQQASVTLAESAGEIATSTVTNTAASLTEDRENASVILMSDTDSKVTIDQAGTYVISGECADGSIVVKKGTTGVVLILEDLNLSSSTGAAVSLNKETEVRLVVSGTVTLTDNENPADENSADAETADAYDGAALKAKAGALVYLTGDGTLNVNGSAKNGIKVSDGESSLVMDGENLTVNITAANDGINAGADLTILSGSLNIAAADDALHSDRILTVGDQNGSAGPDITVNRSTEGLEGTVVNIFGGSVNVISNDDAINATQSEDVTLTASINITGGSVTVKSGGDGLDSNGNVNITGGTTTINSASFGGEAGIDYDGQLYIADTGAINNSSGIAGLDQMGGMGGRGFGQMGGQMARPGQTGNGQMAAPDQAQTGNGQAAAPQGQNGRTMNGGNGRMRNTAGQDTDVNTQATKPQEPNQNTTGGDEQAPVQPQENGTQPMIPQNGGGQADMPQDANGQNAYGRNPGMWNRDGRNADAITQGTRPQRENRTGWNSAVPPQGEIGGQTAVPQEMPGQMMPGMPGNMQDCPGMMGGRGFGGRR